MTLINILLGIFIGLFFGLLCEKYIFPALDMVLEVFTAKQSEKIVFHNANIQATNCQLLKDYPELSDQHIREQINAIGFEYNAPEDEEYCDEDYEDE
ncbi:MAG: hypothetical protein LLF98_02190 [Clostridium sp.]|uniref:hypothetical protein n=1 Tax=Clostridium sp. TaxID=1506 RepID=UPI0025C312D8|nr:hypothetical protein [Clostridium sp.]MCE5220092.1 hypothetical protein [Clostridium sp.]